MGRSMKKTCLAALMIIMSASGVAAGDSDDQEKPKKEKKICKTEKVTGSLTRVNRICMTQAEWDRLNERTRKGLTDLAGSASGAKRCGGSDALAGC